MINFDFNKFCSGCSACSNSCPIQAISMTKNEEGFLVPEIDTTLCINCGKCDKVCPHLNRKLIEGNNNEIKGVWLYASKNKKAKLKSSSGAACFELGKSFIGEGGYICGCIWDDNLDVKHDLGNTLELLEKTQGSKYVQSAIGDVYKGVVQLLKDGKRVLFSGTPCQTTAIHNIVMNIANGKYRDSLLTVAVICHGVASPSAWESYKKWVYEENGSKLVGVNFRDKSKEGYKKSYCRYEYENGVVSYMPTFLPSSKYMEATLVYNLAMRNSCVNCDCKGVNTGIDLIVGDWYAEYDGEGKFGTSCIVAYTSRGKAYAEKHLLGLRSFTYDIVVKGNDPIEKSIKKAANREEFFKRIKDFHYWSRVEELYPAKYKYKKLFIKLGIYDFVKRFL